MQHTSIRVCRFFCNLQRTWRTLPKLRRRGTPRNLHQADIFKSSSNLIHKRHAAEIASLRVQLEDFCHREIQAPERRSYPLHLCCRSVLSIRPRCCKRNFSIPEPVQCLRPNSPCVVCRSWLTSHTVLDFRILVGVGFTCPPHFHTPHRTLRKSDAMMVLDSWTKYW